MLLCVGVGGTNIAVLLGCSKSSRQCDRFMMAQRMSVALHMAAAWEIARELSLAGAEDEAALFGGGVADSVA